MSQHIRVGQIGEDIACEYLKGKGYKIIDRNFRRKWGEIDIVCSKPITNSNESAYQSTVDQVKAKNKKVPHGTSSLLDKLKKLFLKQKNESVDKPRNLWKSYYNINFTSKSNKVIFVEVKTARSGFLRPEDNMTFAKQKKLIRACRVYMSHNNFPAETEWQIDVICITLDKRTGEAKIEHLEQAVYL